MEQKTDITAYDPKAMKNAQELLGNRIHYANNMYDAAKNSDVLAILTEWEEFGKLDLQKIASLMRNKIIIDCRNLLNPQEAKKFNFKYQGIGTG